MKARYWSMSVILGGLAVAGTAWAALDCGVRPTCVELGYTDTADKCDDSGMLKCPFDETAVFCRKKLTGIGCEIGSVLYSDLNCYDPDAAPSGLIAVGVIIDTEDRLAVALTDVNVKWSKDKVDIPGLENCDAFISPGGADMTDCAKDGRANTKIIVDYYGPGTDYAAGYCYAKTDGLAAKSWFLPSMYEILHMKSNIDKIEAALSSVGGESLYMSSMHPLWTSNESEAMFAYSIEKGSSIGDDDKTRGGGLSYMYARCMTNY